MQLYGLIGFPLSHSFSPNYFNEKFARLQLNARYQAFPISSIDSFPDVLASNPALAGLNVTIPYKEIILPYLDKITDQASIIGAVNCIQFNDDKLVGHNTDAAGFWSSIEPYLKVHHRRALILGTGGAAKAIAFALHNNNIQTQFVSRTPDNTSIGYADISEATMSEYLIIVNCTPLGMYPNIDRSPALPYHFLSDKHLMFDVIYNPSETSFLAKSKAMGATTVGGYGMLVAQAEASWHIWNASERY
jgi:shikimate dehydrogenase